MKEFNRGDLVRIIPPDEERQEDLLRDVGFNDDMRTMIGNTYYIDTDDVSHGHTIYRLQGANWNWASEWLELVDCGSAEENEKEFDSVFN